MIVEDPSRADRVEPSKLVKVRFPLPAEDQARGVEAENLWAEPVGGGRFRIENTPFYVYGVSFQDVVLADESAERLSFREVTSRGRHSTYRILVQSPEGYESEQFRTAWEAPPRMTLRRSAKPWKPRAINRLLSGNRV